MEGLSLSIHVYFLLDVPFEKLLNDVEFSLCGTRSSMSCSVLASFLRDALKYAPNFSESVVILMYIRFRSFYTANSQVWCSEDFLAKM